jgi:ABC-type sugar transport system ATPase subunit
MDDGVMSDVELAGVSVERGGTRLLDDVSFTTAAGSLTVIIGSSGAGKSSLLRAVAGLDPLSGGSVRIGGRDMGGVPPGDRDIAMTFQTPVLLPSRNVSRNISFPLELRRATADEIADRVGVEARVLHIDGLLRRSVGRLSAGEAQVVQVARSLVRSPSVLLLDEPFASLEEERIGHVRREMKLLQEAFGVTTLMATNDPRGIMFSADLVVVLERGRVVQVGSPRDVYDRPDTAASAMLTGDADLFAVEIELERDWAWLVHRSFRVRARHPALRRYGARRLQLLARPEWWSIDPRGAIGGVVQQASRWEGSTTVVCDVNGARVVVRVPPGERATRAIERGARIGLRLRRWVLLDPLDGRRIRLGA